MLRKTIEMNPIGSSSISFVLISICACIRARFPRSFCNSTMIMIITMIGPNERTHCNFHLISDSEANGGCSNLYLFCREEKTQQTKRRNVCMVFSILKCNMNVSARVPCSHLRLRKCFFDFRIYNLIYWHFACINRCIEWNFNLFDSTSMCSSQNGINRFWFWHRASMPMQNGFFAFISPEKFAMIFDIVNVTVCAHTKKRYHSAKSRTLLWDVVAHKTKWQRGEQIKPEKSNGIIT